MCLVVSGCVDVCESVCGVCVCVSGCVDVCVDVCRCVSLNVCIKVSRYASGCDAAWCN